MPAPSFFRVVVFASRQVGADLRICLHSRWKNYFCGKLTPAEQVAKILANQRALACMSHWLPDLALQKRKSNEGSKCNICTLEYTHSLFILTISLYIMNQKNYSEYCCKSLVCDTIFGILFFRGFCAKGVTNSSYDMVRLLFSFFKL